MLQPEIQPQFEEPLLLPHQNMMKNRLQWLKDNFFQPRLEDAVAHHSPPVVVQHFEVCIKMVEFLHTMHSKDHEAERRCRLQYFWYQFQHEVVDRDAFDYKVDNISILLHATYTAMGLITEPSGKFMGQLTITKQTPQGPVYLSGPTVDPTDGFPITSDFPQLALALQVNDPQHPQFNQAQGIIQSFQIQVDPNIQYILVVEKDCSFDRLIAGQYPLHTYPGYECLIVTGGGYPDTATKAFVFAMSRLLDLPVYGLVDLDVGGIRCLESFHNCRSNRTLDGGFRYTVNSLWLGPRPSQWAALSIQHGFNVLQARSFYLNDDRKQQLEAIIADQTDSFFVNRELRHLRLQELNQFNDNRICMHIDTIHTIPNYSLTHFVVSVVQAHRANPQHII
jgi:hypothetical protein